MHTSLKCFSISFFEIMTCRPSVAKPLLKEENLLGLTYTTIIVIGKVFFLRLQPVAVTKVLFVQKVVRIVSCLGVTLRTTLRLIEYGTFTPGPLFTKRTDVLPWDLVKSRSRQIGCYIDSIALKFERHLGSSAAEVLVKFWSDWKSLNQRVWDLTRS